MGCFEEEAIPNISSYLTAHEWMIRLHEMEDVPGGEFCEQYLLSSFAFWSPDVGLFLKFEGKRFKTPDSSISRLERDVTFGIFTDLTSYIVSENTSIIDRLLREIRTRLSSHKSSPERVWGYKEEDTVFRTKSELMDAYKRAHSSEKGFFSKAH